MRLQHRGHPVALGQIGVAHDPGRYLGFAVAAAVGHGRDAGDELGLANRTHLDRAVLAVHRVALKKNATHDVVSGGAVFQELMQQVAEARHVPGLAPRAAAGALPEVVVGVDDFQIRVDDGLRRRLGEPVGARWKNAAERGLGRHGVFSRWGGREALAHGLEAGAINGGENQRTTPGSSDRRLG